MRKPLLALTLGLIACLALMTTAFADQQVSITPGGGSQDDVFVLSGTGFVPGTRLAEVYVSPDGQKFTFYIGDTPTVIVVGDDGTFAVPILPRTDFQGGTAGDWGVAVCTIEETPNCWATTITITL